MKTPRPTAAVRAWLPALALLLVLSGAARGEKPTLAQAVEAVTAQVAKGQPLRDAAETLINVLKATKGAGLDPDSIGKLQVAAEALKKEPLGGDKLDSKIAGVLKVDNLPKALNELKEAIANADKLRATDVKARDAALAERDKKRKDLEDKRKAESPDAAAIKTAEDALKTAETTLTAAQQKLDAVVPGYDDAVRLRAAAAALEGALTSLPGKDGSLCKTAAAFLEAGKSVADKLDAELTGTQFPPLTRDSDGPKLHAALGSQIPAFGRAERLNRLLKKAAGPIRKAAGSAELADGLLPADCEASKSPNPYLSAVDKSDGTVRGCVERFPSLWQGVHDYTTAQTKLVSERYGETRRRLRQALRSGDDDPWDDLPKSHAVLAPAMNLIKDMRPADLDWPLLAAQLREVKEHEQPLAAADLDVKSTRTAVDVLAQVASLLRELFVGDIDGFVSEQVRLYYFTNVPRLMQTLNPDTRILNPEGRVAVELAQQRQAMLLKAEQDLHETLGRLGTTQRQVVVIEEEIRIQSQKAAAARKKLDGLRVQLAELEKRRIDASEKVALQQTQVNAKQRAFDEATEKAAAGDATATQALPQLTRDLQVAKEDLTAAQALETVAKDRVASQQKLVDPAVADDTREQNRLTELKGESANADGGLKQLRTKLGELQALVNSTRRSIVEQAQIEAETFGGALDNAPIYFAPASGASTDPIKRVLMYAFADSKTLFIRGKPEDVEKVLDVIAGFDRPAPQARVTLWTLQINSHDPIKINERVHTINRQLRYLRHNINSLQEVLRNAVNKEVNRVAQGMRNLTRGTALEMDQRLNRYFYYPREVRERLGFDLPYQPFWGAATQLQRLNADVQDMAHLVESIATLNYRIEKRKIQGGDEELDDLRSGREMMDEFLYATLREAALDSLPRLKTWITELKGLNCCSTGIECDRNNLETQIEQLNGKARSAFNELESMRECFVKCRQRRDARAIDALFNRSYGYGPVERPGDGGGSPGGVGAGGKSQPADPRVERLERHVGKLKRDVADLNSRISVLEQPPCPCGKPHAHKWPTLIREALGVFDTANTSLRNIARKLTDCSKQCMPPPGAACGAATMQERESPSSPLPDPGSNEKARLILRDIDYATRWTIPDPAHCTTLGETMFVLTLARRSCRLRVLRDFAREMVLFGDGNGSKEDAYETREAASFRRSMLRDFVRHSQSVLRSMLSTNDVDGAAGGGSGPTASGTPFPALPRVLFGALHNQSARLNEDELTANQLEVLLALQSRGRQAVALEIRSLLRQIGLSLDPRGQGDAANPIAGRFRDQYLPMLGWLTRSHVNSPDDFRETRAGGLPPCRLPRSYRECGADTAKLPIDKNGLRGDDAAVRLADRMAWSVAAYEGRRNTLTQSTARVAAADDMIKRLMVIMEDDLDHFFVGPTLQALQDEIHDNVSTTRRFRQRLAGLFGKTPPRVGFGLIERTSILATNRLVARVSPNANAEVTLDAPEDFLAQAQQLAQLAQGVNDSFFARDKTSRGLGAAGAAAGAAKLAGTAATTATLGPIAGVAALLSLLEEQPKEPPGEVYALNTGNVFKVTPIFDPSGQALRFKFDYAATVRLREPDGTTNPSIPRVDRHTVNTEVQLSNMEVREISRFGINAQLGLPERRAGGVPLVRNLPIIKDIPLLGYFTRQASKAGVIQESVILGQTAIYPSVAELVDLLVDVPRRSELGDKPPRYLQPANQDEYKRGPFDETKR